MYIYIIWFDWLIDWLIDLLIDLTTTYIAQMRKTGSMEAVTPATGNKCNRLLSQWPNMNKDDNMNEIKPWYRFNNSRKDRFVKTRLPPQRFCFRIFGVGLLIPFYKRLCLWPFWTFSFRTVAVIGQQPPTVTIPCSGPSKRI